MAFYPRLPRVALLTWTFLALACGAAAPIVGRPSSPSAATLYSDLRKSVAVEERLGWLLDKHELEQALPQVIVSICTAPPEARTDLKAWLAATLTRAGGSARAVYEREGRDLDAVEELLRVERTLALLELASSRLDECPFWLSPRTPFLAQHSTDARLSLTAESGGGGAIRLQRSASAGSDAYGLSLEGGGGGRLLLSIGLSDGWVISSGIELGGRADLLGRDVAGVRAAVAGGIPVLVRRYVDTSVWDMEVAAIAPEIDSLDALTHTPPGVRLSVGYGLSALRSVGLMPHAVLWLGYEWLPAHESRHTSHAIFIGTRAGVNWAWLPD